MERVLWFAEKNCTLDRATNKLLKKKMKFVIMGTDYIWAIRSYRKDRRNELGKDLKGKNLGKGICQRKDGIYQARVFNAGNGKPIYIYDSNLKELKRKRDDAIRKKNIGMSTDQINQTVNSWFEKWMSLYVVGRLKATTIRNYVLSYNRGKDYIGHIKLVDVNTNNAKELQLRKLKPLIL